MNLKDLHHQVVELIKQGQFTKGIEDFYAEDVIQQSNGDAPIQGRQKLADGEREYEAKVTSLDKVDILASVIHDQGGGNGVVMYECQMQWKHQVAGAVNVEQAVVERWKEGKIQSIRFYGTFESENEMTS